MCKCLLVNNNLKYSTFKFTINRHYAKHTHFIQVIKEKKANFVKLRKSLNLVTGDLRRLKWIDNSSNLEPVLISNSNKPDLIRACLKAASQSGLSERIQ